MKVRLEQNWMNHGVKVWFYEPTPQGTLIFDVVAGTHKLLKDGEKEPPPLELPEVALQALAAEAAGILPVSDATSAHLADAVKVRDRLLTLVEQSGSTPQ